jgi:hypothetical protein
MEFSGTTVASLKVVWAEGVRTKTRSSRAPAATVKAIERVSE